MNNYHNMITNLNRLVKNKKQFQKILIKIIKKLPHFFKTFKKSLDSKINEIKHV